MLLRPITTVRDSFVSVARSTLYVVDAKFDEAVNKNYVQDFENIVEQVGQHQIAEQPDEVIKILL